MHPAVVEALRHLGCRDGTPYLKPLGLAKGASWCCAFVVAMVTATVPATHIPRTARVQTLWTRAKADRLRFEIITPTGAAWGKKVRSGDVIVFSHDPDAKDWLGHTGLVIDGPSAGNIVDTVEGNTTCPKEPGDERNGNCVARKQRRAGVHSFMLLGFVRERTEVAGDN